MWLVQGQDKSLPVSNADIFRWTPFPGSSRKTSPVYSVPTEILDARGRFQFQVDPKNACLTDTEEWVLKSRGTSSTTSLPLQKNSYFLCLPFSKNIIGRENIVISHARGGGGGTEEEGRKHRTENSLQSFGPANFESIKNQSDKRCDPLLYKTWRSAQYLKSR
jgi:hypothetical protein